MGTNKGHKKYVSPEKFWDLFEAYRTETKANPIIVTDWVGKDATQVDRKKERPLTLEGFENYVAANSKLQDTGDYFFNIDKRYNDYIPVCKRIKQIIRQDQIEGGMAMIYHHSITARINGLVEKSEVKLEEVNVTMKL